MEEEDGRQQRKRQLRDVVDVAQGALTAHRLLKRKKAEEAATERNARLLAEWERVDVLAKQLGVLGDQASRDNALTRELLISSGVLVLGEGEAAPVLQTRRGAARATDRTSIYDALVELANVEEEASRALQEYEEPDHQELPRDEPREQEAEREQQGERPQGALPQEQPPAGGPAQFRGGAEPPGQLALVPPLDQLGDVYANYGQGQPYQPQVPPPRAPAPGNPFLRAGAGAGQQPPLFPQGQFAHGQVFGEQYQYAPAAFPFGPQQHFPPQPYPYDLGGQQPQPHAAQQMRGGRGDAAHSSGTPLFWDGRQLVAATKPARKTMMDETEFTRMVAAVIGGAAALDAVVSLRGADEAKANVPPGWDELDPATVMAYLNFILGPTAGAAVVSFEKEGMRPEEARARFRRLALDWPFTEEGDRLRGMDGRATHAWTVAWGATVLNECKAWREARGGSRPPAAAGAAYGGSARSSAGAAPGGRDDSRKSRPCFHLAFDKHCPHGAKCIFSHEPAVLANAVRPPGWPQSGKGKR